VDWSTVFHCRQPSGGGFRALSGAFGVVRALNATKIDTISSNSGGTWFLSQCKYDEAFHSAVIDPATTTSRYILEYLAETMPGNLTHLTYCVIYITVRTALQLYTSLAVLA